MSTLTENLQTIYEVKQEIKQVLGTSSDIFTQYPDLIEAAIGQGGGSEPDYNVIWDELIYAPDWTALSDFNENTPFGIYLNDDPSNITYITSNGLKRWSFIDTEGDKIGYVNLWAGNEDGQTEEGIRFTNLMEMYMNPSYTAAITDNTFTIAHGTIVERANETNVYDINAYVIAANMILTNNEVNTIDENGVYGDCQWYVLNDINITETLPTVYLSYNYDEGTGEYGSQVQLVRNQYGNYIYNVGTIEAGDIQHFRFDVEYNSTGFPINGPIYWDQVGIGEWNVQDQGQTQLAQFITDGEDHYVDVVAGISNSLEVDVNNVILSLEPTETNGVMNMNVFVGWIDPTAS